VSGPSRPRRRAAALPTSRGWALLGVGIVLLVAGLLVKIDELFPLALAAGVLVAGALLWVRLRPWQVEGHRVVVPTRVAQGTAAQVQLTVFNTHRWRSPILAARDPFDGGRRWARFALSPIDPGGNVRAKYRLPTSERGTFALGPIEFRLFDPFGLATAARRSGGQSTLSVYPAYERLAPLRDGGGRSDSDGAGPAPIGQQGEEFYALREYQTGDDLRRVHWASSARQGHLMIRQDQDVQRGRVVVIGDLRRDVNTPASFERILSAVASVADAAVRADSEVRVVLTTGEDSGWGNGDSHRAQILDLLAGVDAERTRPPVVLRRFIWEHHQGCSAVVITTDGAAGDDISGLGASRPPLVVVIERDGAPRRSGGVPGALAVPLGSALAAAWARRPTLR
jgi:uncharacterized protein (DUF58 family)